MQKTMKKIENYYPDRTYSDIVGRGKIAETKTVVRNKQTENRNSFLPKTVDKGQSFIHALLSFRWTVYGGCSCFN